MNLIKKSVFIFLLLLMGSVIGFSQDDKDVKIGKDQLIIPQSISFFNYSDPNKVNIIINVWGAVTHPGKYLVPQGTTFLDIISLSAPAPNAILDNIKLLRPKNDSLNRKQDSVTVLNIKDFYFEEELKKKDINNVVLMPGDIIILQIGPTPWFFRDYLNLGLSSLALIVTIINLIVTASK